MKKSAKLLSAVMAGAMVLSMAGCGSSSNSTETTAAAAETTAAAADSSAAESKETTSNTDATVIKLGTTVNEQDSFQVCAEKFAELVKERTNGAYEIEIHPKELSATSVPCLRACRWVLLIWVSSQAARS